MGKWSEVLTFGERESGTIWMDEVDLPIASFFHRSGKAGKYLTQIRKCKKKMRMGQ